MLTASLTSAPVLSYGTAENAGMGPDRIAGIKALGESWVREGIMPALVLLVARRGTVVLHEAFGTLESGTPITPETIFLLASITKPITATALMMLVEDGKVGLGRAVQDYIPEFAGKGKDDVLVHHLLTHTSGLREVDVIAYSLTAGAAVNVPEAGPTEHPAVKQMLHRSYGAPLWKAPGEEMAYCNLNYRLLAEIVRRVSGDSFAAFLEGRIFASLGMRDSFASWPDSQASRLATVPAGSFGAVAAAAGRSMPAMGSGGCYATALDVATFGQTFLNGGCYGTERLLSPATVAQMTRNQIPGIATKFLGEYHAEASWGFGWTVYSDEHWGYFGGYLAPAGSFSHAGSVGGHLWVDPANELVGVYLSVSTGFERGRLRHRFDLFENAVYGALDE